MRKLFNRDASIGMKILIAALTAFLGVCGMNSYAQSQTPVYPQAGAAERRVLRGHVPQVVKNLSSQPNLLPDSQLHLAIGLPLRHKEALNALLQQIYNPTSSQYRHYLTTNQFTEMFGPTEQDYQAVIDFANSHNLKVTTKYPNRMVLDVEGAALDVENAFQVTMRNYRHPTESRVFYAPDVEPSVPAEVPILDISGLNSYSRPHPNLIARPISQPAGGAGSGPGGSYMGNDFRTAYAPGVSLTGAGQTVGLVEFDGYYAIDIAAYEAQAGLPSVTLMNVLLGGFSGTPTGNGGEVEVSLDIDMAISMAPGLSSVIVYEGSPDSSSPNDVLARIATDNLAKQISMSWGFSGGPSATTDQILQQMIAQGQSFFVASGDGDAYYPAGAVDNPANHGTPAASPYVTSVGGTTLTTSWSSGNYLSETVWNPGYYALPWGYIGSSGGVSTNYPIPYWQQVVSKTANHGSTTGRNFPDVALTADNVYVIADNGTNYNVGGTSCAAPLWAGFTALVNQQAQADGRPTVGFINPAVYRIGTWINCPASFHDVTTGNNENTNSPSNYSAVVGYDLCTGWGTPTGSNLVNALASGSGSSTQDVTRTSRFWFTHGGYPSDTYPNCVNLLNAITAVGGGLDLGFTALPTTYRDADSSLTSTDALIEALGFYWRSTGRTGDDNGTQNAKDTASVLCRARKLLSVELIAATANVGLLGTWPMDATYNNGVTTTNFPADLLTQARTVAAGEDIAACNAMTKLLNLFNNSGRLNSFWGSEVECSSSKNSALKKLSRDPTLRDTCPGRNDSCVTAEAVINEGTTSFQFKRSVNTSKFSGNSVWYKIEPDVGRPARPFTANTAGSNYDTMLTVWEGTCGLQTQVAQNDNNGTSLQSRVQFSTDGSNTYYIVVGSGSTGGYGKAKIKVTSP